MKHLLGVDYLPILALCLLSFVNIAGCNSNSATDAATRGESTLAVDAPPATPPEPEVDYFALTVPELLQHAKKVGLAVTVADDCSLSLYPPNEHTKLGAAIVQNSDEVAKAIDPDKWMAKAIIGTWKCPKSEETSFGKFRADGIIEVNREHDSMILGALNSVINGTISYRWAINESQLHTALHSSEEGYMDRLHFLSKSESATITFIDKDHIRVEGPNAVGKGDWYRVGL